MWADASVEVGLWILVGKDSSNPSLVGANSRVKKSLGWWVPLPPPIRKILLGAGLAKRHLQNLEKT